MSKRFVPYTLSIASTVAMSMRPGFFFTIDCFLSHSNYTSSPAPNTTYFLSPISTSRSTVLCFFPVEHHFTQLTPPRSLSKNRRYSTHHAPPCSSPSLLESYNALIRSSAHCSCWYSISRVTAAGADEFITATDCSRVLSPGTSSRASASTCGMGAATTGFCCRSAADTRRSNASSPSVANGLSGFRSLRFWSDARWSESESEDASKGLMGVSSKGLVGVSSKGLRGVSSREL